LAHAGKPMKFFKNIGLWLKTCVEKYRKARNILEKISDCIFNT